MDGLSYLLYTRAAAGLGKWGARMLSAFLLVAVISVLALGLAFVLFIVLLPLFGMWDMYNEEDERIARIILFSCIGAYYVAIIGSLFMSVKELFGNPS